MREEELPLLDEYGWERRVPAIDGTGSEDDAAVKRGRARGRDDAEG